MPVDEIPEIGRGTAQPARVGTRKQLLVHRRNSPKSLFGMARERLLDQVGEWARYTRSLRLERARRRCPDLGQNLFGRRGGVRLRPRDEEIEQGAERKDVARNRRLLAGRLLRTDGRIRADQLGAWSWKGQE
jgi:hypothetical protein